MFRLVEKKNNNYLILDTDDGVVDELNYFQILDYLEHGIEIEGCIKTIKGYHFEIDNSDYHKIIKGYKFRIYPTVKQREYFTQCFGCCRLLWNSMLADKIDYYNTYGENLTVYVTDYKERYPFLNDVDSLALANELQDLNKAYKNFFRDKSVGFPKFKSKKIITGLSVQIIKTVLLNLSIINGLKYQRIKRLDWLDVINRRISKG